MNDNMNNNIDLNESIDINESIGTDVNAEINAIDDSTEEAANVQKKKEKISLTSTIYEALSVVISAVFIICIVFTFLFRLVGVSGNSMVDTLHDGDWLLVAPYYSEPEYGDIVISTHRLESMGPIVKRVIATAGDEVNIDENGNVYVNGVALSEDSYIIPATRRNGDLSYPITVPEGYVMLLGDNRPISSDSRYSYVGFAPVDALLGKALIRLSDDWNIYTNFNN